MGLLYHRGLQDGRLHVKNRLDKPLRHDDLLHVCREHLANRAANFQIGKNSVINELNSIYHRSAHRMERYLANTNPSQAWAVYRAKQVDLVEGFEMVQGVALVGLVFYK